MIGEQLFFGSGGLILLSYLGYPAALWAWTRGKREATPGPPRQWPSMSVVIACRNESGRIRPKLEATMAQEYPGPLEIIVASDHSTDDTDAIVERFGGPVRLISNTQDPGKSSTQNCAVAEARGEILVFTDADTVLSDGVLRKIGSHFQDPEVGCVDGEVAPMPNGTTLGENHSLYWRYEGWLRGLESRAGNLATVSGACIGMRASLYRPIENRFGDDCIIPLDVLLQGRRVIHDPTCLVYDIFPSNPQRELSTRVRMTLRNWTGIWSKSVLLNPLRHPGVAIGLWSHKLLRWLTPYFMLLCLVSSLFLARTPFYAVALLLQVLFYAVCALGWLSTVASWKLRIPEAAYNFSLVNVGFLVGTLKAYLGHRVTLYKS